ncbi:MAG: SAM-dependent chlorinase/fluorinase [Planctomycetota bacterium]
MTTDFGVSSPYVAAMKGVIASINPDARLVDISHAIEPQRIFEAAQVLADSTPLFPAGTIHIAVIDPGVGTERAIVYVEFPWGRYVCPDNGLLDRLAAQSDPTMMVAVTADRFFRHPVAATFHGRDIMAPVAAHLSLGLDPQELGPPHDVLRQLDWPGAVKVANRITGEIVSIDSFGNLISNITREMLADVPTDDTVSVQCDGHETRSIFSTYAEQPPMTLVALIGSTNQLEIAIVDDSAKIMLGVAVGTPIEVCW